MHRRKNHPGEKSQNIATFGLISIIMGSGVLNLENQYVVRSNRESGYGRYDMMVEPKDKSDRISRGRIKTD